MSDCRGTDATRDMMALPMLYPHLPLMADRGKAIIFPSVMCLSPPS